MSEIDFYKTLYFELGFQIVLLNTITSSGICTCGSNLCRSIGKHPVDKWLKKDIIKDRSIKPSEVEMWMGGLFGSNNFGIKTGKSSNQISGKSLIVVDFDDVELESELIAKLRQVNTCEVETGKGVHFYFFSEMKSKIKPSNRGFDIISNGRYVVAPGSVHSSGKKYTWNGLKPIELPEWVKTELTEIFNEETLEIETISKIKNDKKSSKVRFLVKSTVESSKKIPVGQRNSTLFKELMLFAKDKTKTLDDIKEQALVIRKRMEKYENFSLKELEEVCKSVNNYKLKDKINVNKGFSLKEASNIWARKLLNIGIIPNEFQEILLSRLFFNLEIFLLEKSMIKRELTDTFTGTRVTDFIEYREKVFDEVFENIPVWNYINNSFQNWAKVFFDLKLEKRLYVGVKYVGKGAKERRKTGFGFELRSKKEMVDLINSFFGQEIKKLIGFTKKIKGTIKKVNYTTDKRILDYFGIQIKEPKNPILNFKDLNMSISDLIDSGGLSDTSGVVTLAHSPIPCSMTPTKGLNQMSENEKSDKKASPEANGLKKVKDIEVKKEFHKLHYKKYGGMKHLLFAEADMDYQFTVSSKKDGMLTDKETVLNKLNDLKKDDVIGLGFKTAVFESIDLENEEIVVYEKYKLKDRVASDFESKTTIPFSLINKYIDMEYFDILYRDGELFGLDEKERIQKFEIYEVDETAENTSPTEDPSHSEEVKN